MKKVPTLILVCATMALVTGTVCADDGLALMKVEHGARQAGMATAFVSIADDPNGLAYNPAAVSGINEFTASFGHVAYWENVRMESGYFATNLSSRTWFHGGIRYAVVDELEQRSLPTEEPETYFDSHDVSFKTGLSHRLCDRIVAGVSAGWFLEKIGAWRGSAFNVDLGLLATVTPYINLGASVTNVGSSFILEASGAEGSRDISLPTTYRVGGSYRYNYLLGACDFVYVDEQAHAHLGAEATVYGQHALRVGYMAGYDSKDFTAGATFSHRNISVDYAFVPYTNDLGTSHLFNLTFTL